MKMKIIISCSYANSRNVHLASQLDVNGYLHKLYVPYYSRKFPYLAKFIKTEKEREIIDLSKVQTNIKFHSIRSLILRTRKLSDLFIHDKRFMLGEMLDKLVAGQINCGSDIVIAQSEMALYTMQRAKGLGMIAMLDRTNSHIEYQTELLSEEYNKLGMEYVFNTPSVIEKSVKEYHEADYICVLSSFVKRTFLEKGVLEDKLILTFSGVSLDDFKQVEKEDKIFRIIYCGGLTIKKGIHYLLEAVSSLKLKNLELWLVGNIVKDIRPFLDKYRNYYKFLGILPHYKLYRYFSQGSVLVLPSLEEGMVRVMLEAMACGLPIIATTNTGAEDVVRNGIDGFIIPIRNVEALKEKITYMYESQNMCRQMGQNAKERVRKEFTWEQYADRIINACKNILDKRG